MRDYKKLDVWKMAIDVTVRVYRITKEFPNDELYGLVSQMRRAAVSVSSNIAEGCGRKTEKAFITFLYNAMGSLKELECQVYISQRLGYLKDEGFEEINKELVLLGKKLVNFIKHIRSKNGIE
jgi:four helix bundle protein